MQAVTDKIYTEGEYLLLEEKAQQKHEFYNGSILKMPGASYTHNLIAANIITELDIARKNDPKTILFVPAT